MNATANLARRPHQRYVTGSPAQAEARGRDTASVRAMTVKPTRHSLVEEIEELDAWAALLAGPAAQTESWGVLGAHLLMNEGGYDTVHWPDPAAIDPEQCAAMIRALFRQSEQGIAVLPAGDAGDLHDALADLDRLNEEAREEDLPEPDAEAVENARILLPRLFEIYPVRYQVSPTERRGVTIEAPMKWGAAVAVECAPSDTVYCFAAIDGNSRRAKFYQMDGLPDVFIEKALRDLAAG